MILFLGATLVPIAVIAIAARAMAGDPRRGSRDVLTTVATVAKFLGITNAAVLGVLIGISLLQA